MKWNAIQTKAQLLKAMVKDLTYLGCTIDEYVTWLKVVKKCIAIAASQTAMLNRIWSSKNIGAKNKIKLLKDIVTSITFYGCEPWTWTKIMEYRIDAFGIRCFGGLLRISRKEHRTNESAINEITCCIGECEPLMIQIVRRRKLQLFVLVSRGPGTMAHTIMHGSVGGS